MSKLEIIAFALAGIGFVTWLAATLADVAVEESYVLLAALVFFVIGFVSLIIRYANAVAPEWSDE